jgi:hypothetical protein
MDRRTGRRVGKLRLAGLAASLALLVGASGAEARRHHAVHHVRGVVVVHRNRGAGSFVVANARGRLFAVHGAQSPALGADVAVSVRRLRNDTFAARKVHANGTSSHSRIRGTVTHVNGAAKTFVVSAEGVSMLVKGRAAGALPEVGKLVTVTGTIDDENEGQLEEEDLQEEGEDNNGFDVEGMILEVNTVARTLTVTAEDDQTENETVTVDVPSSIDISAFHAGEEVDLTVTPLTGGGFELVASSSDEGEQGAQDGEDETGRTGRRRTRNGRRRKRTVGVADPSPPRATARHVFTPAALPCWAAGGPRRLSPAATDARRRKETRRGQRGGRRYYLIFFSATRRWKFVTSPAVLRTVPLASTWKDPRFRYLRPAALSLSASFAVWPPVILPVTVPTRTRAAA